MYPIGILHVYILGLMMMVTIISLGQMHERRDSIANALRVSLSCTTHRYVYTVEPLWKGWESVTKFAKCGLFPSMYHSLQIEGILPKGPYPPCLRMADRALLAGYPRNRCLFYPHETRPLLKGHHLKRGVPLYAHSIQFLDLKY